MRHKPKILSEAMRIGTSLHEKIFGIHPGGIAVEEQSKSRLNRANDSSVAATVTVEMIKKAMDKIPKSTIRDPLHLSYSQFELYSNIALPSDTKVFYPDGSIKTVGEIRKERLKIFKEIGS